MTTWTLANHKESPEMSEETIACSGELLMDGEIVGHYRNSGGGEGTYVRWNNREARIAFTAMLTERILAKQAAGGKLLGKTLGDTLAWEEELWLDEQIAALPRP